MPRYLVERTFPGGLAIPANAAGARVWQRVVQENASCGVTWLYSYLSDDLETMVCVYDSPSPAAIRQAAARNHLPVDRMTLVTILDANAYRGATK